MTDPSGTTPSPLAPVALERQSWQTSTAPQYIGLFLWVVYFDQLGRCTLATGGLGPSVLGASLAGLLCYLLLYRVPAIWGFRTGKPLTILGTSTFGASGSTWIIGVLMGLAHVVWFAAATYYATDLTFRGLVSFGLMAPKHLRPIELGASGLSLRLPNALFLVTSLTWSFAAAMVGHYLVKIIAALMRVFPIFMAVALAFAMLRTIGDVPRFRPSEPTPDGGLHAFALMVELIFGFFAPAGAMAADWGAVNRTERDVRLGGGIGVALASWTVATLALLTVAGALGNAPLPEGPARGLGAGPVVEDYTFREAVLKGIGGTLGGTILLVFGLSSLAPTCYAAYNFGHRFASAWPGVKRIHRTLLGTTAAWLLIAGGCADRLETIFSLMGAAFAPAVAAMAAEYVRHRGNWPGPRQGVNPPGLAAWAVGLAVGLVPIVAEAAGWHAGTRFQPAAVLAFLAAFVTYLILAGLGAEEPPLPPPEVNRGDAAESSIDPQPTQTS